MTSPNDPAMRVARVFDRVDPVRGPEFDPTHVRIPDPGERDLVLRYLRSGAVVLATTERMADMVEPTRGQVVPLSFRTDGHWIWTDTVTYYLSTHQLAPDADLLAHIRAAGHTPPVIPEDAAERALAVLQQPTPDQPSRDNGHRN